MDSTRTPMIYISSGLSPVLLRSCTLCLSPSSQPHRAPRTQSLSPRAAFKIFHTFKQLCKHVALVAIAAMMKAARWICQQLPGDSWFCYPSFLAATFLPGLVSHSCALSLTFSVESTIPRKAQITEPSALEEHSASDWGLSRNTEPHYWSLSHTSEYQLSSLPAIWCKLNCEIYGYKGIQHRKSWYQWHSYTSLLLDKFCQQFCNQPLGAAAGLLICWAANTRGVKVVNSTWKSSVLA